MHVPGWHEATRELEAAGKIQVAGIVEEQHPDRALLFMQWKAMDWPVMVDQLDLLGVWLVPITVLIDEYGIVRSIPPHGANPARALEEFLAAEYAEPAEHAVEAQPPATPPGAGAFSGPDQWRRRADHLFRWGGLEGLDGALECYRHAVELDPGDAVSRFRLGVTFRARYDSPSRQEGDFQAAVYHWTQALAEQPNQYIWRRRIQQYGPRLDKPYPFYDWVHEARRALEARGVVPHPLTVEPAGAELAGPAKAVVTAASDPGRRPDPEGRIRRDPGRLVRLDTAVVPAEIPPGGAARIYVAMTPSAELGAHWNNEAGDHEVWVDPPPGWRGGASHVVLPPGSEAVSEETRRLDVEVRAPTGSADSGEVTGHTLYYVCEGADGVCMYRRQDFQVEVPVSAEAPVLGTR